MDPSREGEQRRLCITVCSRQISAPLWTLPLSLQWNIRGWSLGTLLQSWESIYRAVSGRQALGALCCSLGGPELWPVPADPQPGPLASVVIHQGEVALEVGALGLGSASG